MIEYTFTDIDRLGISFPLIKKENNTYYFYNSNINVWIMYVEQYIGYAHFHFSFNIPLTEEEVNSYLMIGELQK